MKRLTLFATLTVSILAICRPAASEEPLTAPGPSGPLAGTLRLAPAQHAPVVLIIPGSGPVDRDGNSPAGLQAATYRFLAEGLALHGITTLRIDKRGLFGSQAAVPDGNQVTIDDYAADIRRWIVVLRARTGASCVWLLGHSEGGLVALLAAQPEPTCGLILVATPGRSLGEVLRSQLRANPANVPILPRALSIIASLEAGQHVAAAGISPALMPLFRPAIQDFLMSELALKPNKLIAGIREPVLILQGDRDLQVEPADARRLADANPVARLEILPNVNHVLKQVRSDDRSENLRTYVDPSLKLASDVVDQVSDIVHARPAPADVRSGSGHAASSATSLTDSGSDETRLRLVQDTPPLLTISALETQQRKHGPYRRAVQAASPHVSGRV